MVRGMQIGCAAVELIFRNTETYFPVPAAIVAQ
jgi:hypothetical protein